jgi:hypothetical protein
MRSRIVSLLVAGFFAVSAVASAQAPRTWVSGVGDDVNPCSRTAPCKTFAGAISKTAAQGEISVLDPGGFGTVTITKSISIVAASDEGGISSATVNGIIVNAGATDTVTLRGLTINGSNTGINGIRFLNGGTLHVQDCTIERVTGFGISFEPSGASQLTVTDTIVRNNLGGTGGGILLRPGSLGSANATFDRVTSSRNRIGFRVEDRAKATVRNSTASSNTNFGFSVLSTAAAAELNVSSSQAANNTLAGVRSEGALAMLRINDVGVFDNGTGLASIGGGALLSFGTNQIAGNGANGAPTGPLAQQ